MFKNFVKNLFGSSNDREINKLSSKILAIKEIEKSIQSKSDHELASSTGLFRERLR